MTGTLVPVHSYELEVIINPADSLHTLGTSISLIFLVNRKLRSGNWSKYWHTFPAYSA